MRRPTIRAAKEGRGSAGAGRGPRLLRMLGWGPADAAGAVLVGCVAAGILANVLFMQSGSHPAPMFKGPLTPAKPVPVNAGAAAAAASPRQAEAAPVPAKPTLSRTPGEIIGDIQRELARRGYYDGAIDGFYGPKTDGAIRDFEQVAGLKPSLQPNEALLQAITRAPAKFAKSASAIAPPAARPAAARGDGATAIGPPTSRRVVALQRALAEYGYGQIKPSGILDNETQAAIERFERERKLPITGQASDRVMRELAAMTGRPLE